MRAYGQGHLAVEKDSMATTVATSGCTQERQVLKLRYKLPKLIGVAEDLQYAGAINMYRG